VPKDTGLIVLMLNGRKAEEVRWDANGLLTLSTGDGAKSAERVDLRVVACLPIEFPRCSLRVSR